jgi:hypothetical protein
MRIELKYTTACPSSNRVQKELEEIIADAGLPLAIELTESSGEDSTTIWIHASGNAPSESSSENIDCEEMHSAEKQFLDKLRNTVLQKWHEHAVSPLSHLR